MASLRRSLGELKRSIKLDALPAASIELLACPVRHGRHRMAERQGSDRSSPQPIAQRHACASKTGQRCAEHHKRRGRYRQRQATCIA